MEDLKGFSLSPALSFRTSEWNFELVGPEDLDPRANTPKENALILLNRATAVVEYFQRCFCRVSNPYFGKTVNPRSRFNKHNTQKGKPNEMIVMVTLAVLGENDIPLLERERCEHTVDSWGCTMERLLINAAKRHGFAL